MGNNITMDMSQAKYKYETADGFNCLGTQAFIKTVLPLQCQQQQEISCEKFQCDEY